MPDQASNQSHPPSRQQETSGPTVQIEPMYGLTPKMGTGSGQAVPGFEELTLACAPILMARRHVSLPAEPTVTDRPCGFCGEADERQAVLDPAGTPVHPTCWAIAHRAEATWTLWSAVMYAESVQRELGGLDVDLDELARLSQQLLNLTSRYGGF